MSTSDVFPCASKQGASKYTTGPEPAGGSARGAGTVCPQMVAGFPEAAAGCGAGVSTWGTIGLAAAAACACAIGVGSKRLPSMKTGKPLNMQSFLVCRGALKSLLYWILDAEGSPAALGRDRNSGAAPGSGYLVIGQRIRDSSITDQLTR